MGVVSLGSGETIKFKGSTSTELVGCIYCDECGSFKIGRRLNLKNMIPIFCTVLILYSIWDNYGNTFKSIAFSFFIFLVIVMFLQPFGLFELGYICKKCKNSRISLKINTLGIKEFDKNWI